MPEPTPPILASGIPVHCAHRELVDVTTLVPNPRNPNSHPDKQIALLAKVIRHQGWRAPITVSNRSGFVVTGHGRLEAAKLLQVELVPVDRQEFATEADEWAHLVADNRLAELAENDEAAIKTLLDELDAGGLDLELAGFDADGLAGLVADAAEDFPTDSTYTNKIALPVYEPKGECPPVSDLIDRRKTDELLAEIEAIPMPSEVAGFLRCAAERHTQFNFRQIAEFYCHADDTVKDLMEKSALVLIDFDKAIENGFVHLTERLGELADKEEFNES